DAPRRIPAGEDVGKVMRKAVVWWREHHRDLTAYLVQELEHRFTRLRVVVVVQVQIEERELELAHGLHPALKILGGEHLVEQAARQRRTRVDVAGHRLKDFPLPAEVLHELR